MTLGSSVSVRSAARLGSVISALGFVVLGSSVSVRGQFQFGSTFSVTDS